MSVATHGKAGFTSRFEPGEATELNEMSGHDDGYFDLAINDAYIPKFLEEYGGMHESRVGSGLFDGMIFMSNSRTKKECFRRKLFGLPGSYASIVKHVKPGMKLFLFEYERREMHGIFEATTSGAMNIEPSAFKGSGRQFPAQVRFRRVWDCYPLSENDFKKAIHENYHTRKEFYFALSGVQVAKLVDLFGQQKSQLQVSVHADYDEDSQYLSRIGIKHETANFHQETERNMSKRDYNAEDAMYGHSDGEQERACTRESYCKDLLFTGNVYAGQSMHGISNAGQILPSSGGLTYEDQSNDYLHAVQTLNYISDADPRLGSYSAQLTNSANFDRLNSEHQSYYARHPNFEENTANVFVARDTAINSNNVNEEIYDNRYRELFFPSNSQHHDNLYYNETRMSHSSLCLDSLPLILTQPVIEMFNGEGSQDSSQVTLSNSPVNHVNNSSNDDCFPKQSVFSRLKRVPEIGVLHDKEHTVFRPTYQTRQKHKRKFGSFAIDEIESSGKQDESMSDAESTDEPNVKDGVVINFKRRSQVTKYGKETTLQVEGETNPSDGEKNSNRQKRRKLIRPQFDTGKINENTMDVIQSCSKECPSQSGLSRTAILDDKKEGCDSRKESGEVLANVNVTEHSDCCNVQTVEAENNGLANLDSTESYRKECPCQLVCPSSEILATQNAESDRGQGNMIASSFLDDKKEGCDSRQESGEVLANETERSDCCNVQTVEAKNNGLANLDGSESYRKECPCQLVSPSSEILATQNAESDCGQENGKASSILDDKKEGCDSRQKIGEVFANVTEHSDCCNVQTVEAKNNGPSNLNGSESYREECPYQMVCPSSKILAAQNAESDCGQENGKASLILDDKKKGCDSREKIGEVLANVTEHSDCCNVQTVEAKNNGLANLDGSESYREECPCQMVCPSSEILAAQNAENDCGRENGKASLILDDKKEGCDSRQESGEVLANVTEHSDCCNFQAVEAKNKGLANFDGSESYREECPYQMVCPSSKILATQNAETECGQENGKPSSNKRRCADSCEFQVMGELKSQDMAMVDLNKPYVTE